MLSRVNPYGTLILTRSEMAQFISEVEVEFVKVGDEEVRNLLNRVLGLARECENNEANELRLEGD